MIVYLEIPISGVAKWLEGVVDMWNGMGTVEVAILGTFSVYLLTFKMLKYDV